MLIIIGETQVIIASPGERRLLEWNTVTPGLTRGPFL